jgi:beta-galactosidase
VLSDKLQEQVLLAVLQLAGLTSSDQQLPENVRVKHGVNGGGRRIHYYFNYSSRPQTFPYAYATGSELLTQKAVASSQPITLAPWDLAIVEEK